MTMHCAVATPTQKKLLKNHVKSLDNKLKCDSHSFESQYVNQSIQPSNETLVNLAQAYSNAHLMCDKAKIELQVITNGSFLLMLEFSKLLAPKNIECWGYLVLIKSRQQLTSFYLNFGAKKLRRKRERMVPITMEAEVSYEVTIISLPTYKQQKLVQNATGKCEMEMLTHIYNQSRENLKEKCSRYSLPTFKTVQQVATELCSTSPNQMDERLTRLLTLDCDMRLQPLIRATRKKNTEKILSILLFISIFFLIFLILCYCIIKTRICKKSHVKHCPELLTQGQHCTVMILHRPGCIILEKFLRDFAYLLTVYNVDVRTSLLEQASVDSQGGIALYLQKNLQFCDYVFILITEGEHEHPLHKHKPFEFALQVITGALFHQNDVHKFIPIYLSSYKQTINYFPSFLLDAKQDGYQIPYDFNKIVTSLSPNVDNKTLKKKKENNCIIFNRMESLSKQYLQDLHDVCYSDNCVKGEKYFSKSNLSAIWGSTTKSRSSSFASMDTGQKHVYVNEINPRKFKNLWEKKSHSYDNISTRATEKRRQVFLL